MIAQPTQPTPQAAFQSASLYVGDLHQEVTEVLSCIYNNYLYCFIYFYII